VDTKIEIRRAVPADAEAIEHIARATWNSAYADIILPENRERLLARWYAPDALRDSIDQKDSWFFVALADKVEKDNQVGKTFYEKNGFRFSREFSIDLREQQLVLQEFVFRIHDQYNAG